MKTFFSILLGLILATSTLVGTAYAISTVQPTQSSGGNTNVCSQISSSNPNYITYGCGPNGGNVYQMHNGGNGGDPHGGCQSSRLGLDGCCDGGITPHSFELSDIQADTACR